MDLLIEDDGFSANQILTSLTLRTICGNNFIVSIEFGRINDLLRTMYLPTYLVGSYTKNRYLDKTLQQGLYFAVNVSLKCKPCITVFIECLFVTFSKHFIYAVFFTNSHGYSISWWWIACVNYSFSLSLCEFTKLYICFDKT